MRAIVARELGPPEKLRLETLPSPSPSRDDVLVRTHAAAVNFPDLLVMEGKYQVRPPLPFTPGKEAAGVVEAIGEDVTGFAPGDRVMVQVEWGAYAEKICVPENLCFPVPEGVRMEDAAAIGIAYQTAYFALKERAGLKAGDRVLVTGASGSVGQAAVQLAKAWDCEVIAGLTTVSKQDVARENGADHVIDLSTENPRDDIREQVQAAVGNVDIVVEAVGGEVFDGAIRALGLGGRLVVLGFTGGIIPSFRVNYALLKNISVGGVNWSVYRDIDPARVRRVQAEIFELLQEGLVRVPVQAVYPMEEIVKACDVIRNRDVRGKVVITTAP